MKVRDATVYLQDETIKGMNEGKDLFTLMREIELPPALRPAHSRGPAAWCVRAIFEEYVGWFRAESVTELYGIPPSSVWGELTELAGGPDVLADRAADRLAAGEPVQALHLVDMLRSVDPDHRRGREVELAALEALLERSGVVDWDDARLLELEIGRVRGELA
jgi:alkyl sulfatase BDS1-like metallo-beta-lactamase superfamily hydrolase